MPILTVRLVESVWRESAKMIPALLSVARLRSCVFRGNARTCAKTNHATLENPVYTVPAFLPTVTIWAVLQEGSACKVHVPMILVAP